MKHKIFLVAAFAVFVMGIASQEMEDKPMPPTVTISVSGAGESSVNGTYDERGTHNGEPYYNKVGSPSNPLTDAISHRDGAWSIYDSNSEQTYYGEGDSPTEVETWKCEPFRDPAPTVE